MKWGIITDSSCDFAIERVIPKNIKIEKVPFVITIGEKDYIDDEHLNVENMIDAMEACSEACHTSCPSPEKWYNLFEGCDNIIAITISEKLSGSYNSAIVAKNMILEKYPDKNIFILNSRSAGSVLSMYVEKTIELIEQELNFQQIVSSLEEIVKTKHTVFALASCSNLVKNGRVGKLAGFLAKKLKLWGIGVASKEGTILVKKKTIGINNVLSFFVKDMKENNFDGDSVVISHCQNLELATKLRDRILEVWKKIKVKILSTRGLCSFYAERKGLIVAY